MKTILFALLVLTVSTYAAVNPLPEGIYVLFSNLTGQVLTVARNSTDNNAPIATNPFHLGVNQAFFINHAATPMEDWSMMLNANSQKFIINPDGSTGNVDLVQKMPDDSFKNNIASVTGMLWRFVPKGHGLYAIQNKASGKYITVRNNAGEHVYQSAYTGKPNQLFRLLHITPQQPPIEDGKTYFLLGGEKVFALGVGSESRVDGAEVHGFPFYGSPSQYFKAVRADSDSFYFININSGKALTVNYNDKAGAHPYQETLLRVDDQKWRVRNVEDDMFIQSKATGLHLEIPDNSDGSVSLAPFSQHTKGQSFVAVEVK